ncbi:hypothetical protein ACS78_10980 [Priestia megaterium]|uniref:hypothetical protein n=1 Tax=Priestia megaterium TaxID=1404 RepID=UPI000680EDFF|nr:hypothetical protein [Priestia megaterium]KNH22906.1 hypothetical protein ACS78_10980 [Priestia megaterium]
MSKLPKSNNDNSVRSPDERPPGLPRWVKVSLIIVIALILLFVIMNITGIGGKHGPMRHFNHTLSTEHTGAQQT